MVFQMHYEDILKSLCNSLEGIPIIAEGKICTLEDAAKVAQLHVWSIVIGSAITRPQLITQWFVDSINNIK